VTTKKLERIEVVCAILLAGAFVALMLFPYGKNGLWFDDSLNSQMWGMINRFDSTLWGFSVIVSEAWWYGAGRILLCWPAIYSFFYVTRDPLVVRLADLGFVLAHVGCVVYLLRRVRISWPVIGVFLLFLFSLFQIRNNDDPIAAYATFCQTLGIALTLGMILLVKFTESGASRHLVAAMVLIVLSLLCYELNVVFIPLALVVIWRSGHAHRWRNLMIVLVPFAIFVAVTLYLKRSTPNPYAGSEFGTLGAIPRTYLKQVIAAFPGSFYGLRSHADYPLRTLLPTTVKNPAAWAVALFAALSYALVSKQQRCTSSGASAGVVATAAFMVLVPPVLISVSARYQVQLGWGDAHLPVYYEYFGVAFLGALASQWIVKNCRRLTLVLLVSCFATYAALNWTMNLRQVNYLDQSYAVPRDTFVDALQHGLLDAVRDGDIVEMKDVPIFINGNLVYQTIEKKVAVPNETASISFFKPDARPDARTFQLRWAPGTSQPWWLDGPDTSTPR
jgi:hypothetical protein